ncbi:MAG TPA: MarR family winged helix-turn-helix transcriptional regulator [Stenomitos sp.]
MTHIYPCDRPLGGAEGNRSSTDQSGEDCNPCCHDSLDIQETQTLMNSEPSSTDITPEQCATEVMETIPLVMQFLRTEMRSQNSPDLSVPQFRTLAFLNRHPGASLSDLAEHLGVTRATASAITERLVQRGLVDRRERPEERRHVVLKLTQAGSEYLQHIRQITRTQIAKMFANLSQTQLRHVVEGLAVLNDVMEGKANELEGS